MKMLEALEITHDDFCQAKDNWRRTLVGDRDIDFENKYIASKVLHINKLGQLAWDSMNRSEDASVLFGIAPVDTSHKMGEQYMRLQELAVAYGTYGGELYQNHLLEEDILYGLEWLYEHFYGWHEINGDGWRDIKAFNWWDWYVYVPMCLESVMVILESVLTPAMISKYLSLFHHIRSFMRTGKTREHIHSRLQVVTGAAMLEEDTELMLACLEDIRESLQIVPDGQNGPNRDYSYIAHNVYPLTGAYGTSILCGRLIRTVSILTGTRFEISGPDKYNLALWMYHLFDPLMYKGCVMAMVNGRIPCKGEVYGRYVIAGILDLLGCFSPEDDMRLKEFLGRCVEPDNIDEIVNALTMEQIVRLVNVLAEKQEVKPLTYAHIYYNQDRVLQRRPGYAVGIAMSSRRIGNYECINDNNLTGWYQGDGMVYIHNNLSHADAYGSRFWEGVNPYRLSGTTEDDQPRMAASYNRPYLSPPVFVGGVEIDQEFAMAVMDFEAFHNDMPPQSKGIGHGGDFDLHSNNLTAKKAWFLFDDEVVALGAGICSTTGSRVATTVEDRPFDDIYAKAGSFLKSVDAEEDEQLRSAVTEVGTNVVTIDGRRYIVQGLEAVYENPSWAQLDGVGGYYFPQGGALYVRAGARDNSFLEMWIDHGISPQDADYAYCLLPNKTSVETAVYAEDPDITILENTSKIQAVKERTTGITGVVFWKAGSISGITATGPMAVMVRDSAGERVICVADPSQLSDPADMILKGRWAVREGDSEITEACEGDSTVLHIGFDHSGRTLTVKLTAI